MQAGLGWAGAPVGQTEGSSHLLPLPDVPTVGVGGSLGSGAALCEERVQTRGWGCQAVQLEFRSGVCGGRWEAWPRPAVLFWSRLHAGTLWSDLEVLEGPGEPAPSLNQPTPADGGSHRARRPLLWDVQQGGLGGELLTAGQAQTLLS